MVQRHLAGFQHEINHLGLVDFHLDLLPSRQEVVLGKRVEVRLDGQFLGPRHNPHTAIRRIADRQCDPGGRHPRGIQPPVSPILVPGDPGWIARWFGK